MPIVIMKSDIVPPSYQDWVRPYAVWQGTWKEAWDWCEAKNNHPKNRTTRYEPVRVKNEPVESARKRTT